MKIRTEMILNVEELKGLMETYKRGFEKFAEVDTKNGDYALSQEDCMELANDIINNQAEGYSLYENEDGTYTFINEYETDYAKPVFDQIGINFDWLAEHPEIEE